MKLTVFYVSETKLHLNSLEHFVELKQSDSIEKLDFIKVNKIGTLLTDVFHS
jgi:hypothetical protein